MRYIYILAVIGILYLAFKRLYGSRLPRRRRPPDGNSPTNQPMVQCSHCGVYLPDEQAIRDGALIFCSKAHKIAHGK